MHIIPLNFSLVNLSGQHFLIEKKKKKQLLRVHFAFFRKKGPRLYQNRYVSCGVKAHTSCHIMGVSESNVYN